MVAAVRKLEARARDLLTSEELTYVSKRPRSAAAHESRKAACLAGVPMHWMSDWPMPFPMVIERASGTRLIDIDGNELVDLCLGDTGAMFGHAPEPILAALRRCAVRGFTTMLPSEDAAVVAGLLAERFKLPRWQIATTASDANRFAIRAARAVTGRPKILVFDGCYHGAVDDTLVDLDGTRTVARRSLVGQVTDPGRISVAIPFNDEDALHRALGSRDVACVLAEPVMTNCGMIFPKPGFLQALREATRNTGTLLLFDETHTLCAGPGGYAGIHGPRPDILVVGKAVGGGVPVSVWGMSEEVAERLETALRSRDTQGHSGIGTTLSGNALQLACLRACLEEVMTPQNFGIMVGLGMHMAGSLLDVIAGFHLPWHVANLGARVEVIFSPAPALNAVQARAASAPLIEAALHMAMLNHGFLLTPFHNMLLASPALSQGDADRLVGAYADVVGRLTATTLS